MEVVLGNYTREELQRYDGPTLRYLAYTCVWGQTPTGQALRRIRNFGDENKENDIDYLLNHQRTITFKRIKVVWG